MAIAKIFYDYDEGIWIGKLQNSAREWSVYDPLGLYVTENGKGEIFEAEVVAFDENNTLEVVG